jgi:hypothetical protein
MLRKKIRRFKNLVIIKFILNLRQTTF